jgi:hypothetical protein
MTKRRSRSEKEVPLYLLPLAIARRVREWGAVVYRIRIVRTRWHHYNVTVRTRRIRKELAPESTAVFEQVPGPAGTQAKGRKRRECAA